MIRTSLPEPLRRLQVLPAPRWRLETRTGGDGGDGGPSDSRVMTEQGEGAPVATVIIALLAFISGPCHRARQRAVGVAHMRLAWLKPTPMLVASLMLRVQNEALLKVESWYEGPEDEWNSGACA